MNQAALEVELVLVGGEILDGWVREANAPQVIDLCRSLGITVRRLSLVRDDVVDISDALKPAIRAGGPRLVLTIGGIGGTWDDVTHAGVARAVGRPLELNGDLARPVHTALRHVAELGMPADAAGRAAMFRMAEVPEGAEPRIVRSWLACTVLDLNGGCLHGGTTVVSLPGPPGHLETMLADVVRPEFLVPARRELHTLEVAHDWPEHVLATIFARVRGEFPEVEMGSYPGCPMKIRFVGAADAVEAAAADVIAELARLDDLDAAHRVKRMWQGQVSDWTLDAAAAR